MKSDDLRGDSECVLGDVVVTGTMHDGYCFTRARYTRNGNVSSNKRCHLFETMPDGDYEGEEKACWAFFTNVSVGRSVP